ncbi:MAG TPA: class I SAM-dependent methyltransferase [Aggregatilineaceae bacterium]|jgi:SAM-dependent methyltransferase|nr:class I SAM-dependent methyltransferase [Aggregatilineaceae bacterium]
MTTPPEHATSAESGASDLFLDVLRLSKTQEHTRREADYVEMLLDLSAPAHLLDVPCGGGRLAIELATRRHRVAGVDIEPFLLQEARRAAQERQVEAAFTAVQRDMRDLPWTAEFDGAYCFWESFGYFDDAGNRAFLEAVASALKPSSRFVFDTHIMETALPHMHFRDWEWVGGNILVLEEREYDHVAGTMIRHWTFMQGGRTERRSLAFRLYTYRELVALLEAAGFTACEGYTWLSVVPFALGAPRLVMSAAKA